MNKSAILQAIIATLEAQVAAYARASRAAFDAATDPDSKAENKYDTRSLEASYVARGQATRLAETEQALSDFRALDDARREEVALGSVVVVQGSAGVRSVYFIGPGAGGTEVLDEGQEVYVITPASPLGQQLLGKRAGETLALRLGAPPQSMQIVSVG